MTAYIKRYLKRPVTADLQKKMVFLAGPRQCGKTTFARHLLGKNADERYWNWDITAHRESILREEYPAAEGSFVFDEIHKYGNWRQYLKGLYDLKGTKLHILVTGSARLDHYRRGGDSLQGRYHFYRLHPLSYREIGADGPSALHDLMQFGGFPEPFISASVKETRRWSREYRQRLINDEITSLERINELSKLEQLALRLPDLVGSPLSVNALREDLQVAHTTVARWIEILERLYAVFRIYPMGGPAIRAVKKEAKHYHYDWTQVADEGARFENLVASHLLKWCHFRQDTEGYDTELRYFRDTDGREVDFVIMESGQPVQFIECKLNDRKASTALRYLSRKYPGVPATQVCLKKDVHVVNKDGIRICNAAYVFKNLV